MGHIQSVISLFDSPMCIISCKEKYIQNLVQSVLTYGSETWVMMVENLSSLDGA